MMEIKNVKKIQSMLTVAIGFNVIIKNTLNLRRKKKQNLMKTTYLVTRD